MAIENMNDGVGKKIVEALKMQSAGAPNGDVVISEEPQENDSTEQNYDEFADLQADSSQTIAQNDNLQPEQNNAKQPSEVYNAQFEEPNISSDNFIPNLQSSIHPSERQMQIKSQLQFQAATQGASPQSFIDSAFNQSIVQALGAGYTQTQDDFEYPSNVAVLKQLIAKLPSGVPKQTGALIIKQTMEALGISMGSVLQEAKQVQVALTNNSKECQSSIVEYRKQIGILEAKAQSYQHQAAIMNEIINLFIQTR